MSSDGLVLACCRRSSRSVSWFASVAVVVFATGCAEALPSARVPAQNAALPAGAPDRDRDGLLDAEEDELAARYAPIVILHERDVNLPASVQWLLARTDPFESSAQRRQSPSVLSRRAPMSTWRRPDWHAGSEDPRDWTTYVHVFPRPDGGISIQYWFFYPYNDGPLFFDHDHDWEHVTVRLHAAGEPRHIDLAQHANDSPGVSYTWSSVDREGNHPIVYSALGTHASYPDGAELAWFERVAACAKPEHCSRVWRTWQAGGLQNLGERGRALCHERALSFRDRWGQSGIIPGTSSPFGPLQHSGYCIHGTADCSQEPTIPVSTSAGNERASAH